MAYAAWWAWWAAAGADGTGSVIAVAGGGRFEAVDGDRISAYAHPPANKLGVLVHLRGGDDELARNLAMHISWSDPRWVGRDNVPAEVVATERAIYLNSDEVQSKPVEAREKIVDGMLNKRFFGERGGVLADQPWIHDSSLTVGRVLADQGAAVTKVEQPGSGDTARGDGNNQPGGSGATGAAAGTSQTSIGANKTAF